MKRTITGLLAWSMILATAVAAPGAMTRSPSGIDDRLYFEWDLGRRGDRPVISGYLYNDYKRIATNVVILTETLDASGQVTRRTLSVLPSIVPATGRLYFEVSPGSTGSGYRVAVTSFEWYAGGAS